MWVASIPLWILSAFFGLIGFGSLIHTFSDRCVDNRFAAALIAMVAGLLLSSGFAAAALWVAS